MKNATITVNDSMQDIPDSQNPPTSQTPSIPNYLMPYSMSERLVEAQRATSQLLDSNQSMLMSAMKYSKSSRTESEPKTISPKDTMLDYKSRTNDLPIPVSGQKTTALSASYPAVPATPSRQQKFNQIDQAREQEELENTVTGPLRQDEEMFDPRDADFNPSGKRRRRPSIDNELDFKQANSNIDSEHRWTIPHENADTEQPRASVKSPKHLSPPQPHASMQDYHYHMQLMLLEEQNKKRLLQARRAPDRWSKNHKG